MGRQKLGKQFVSSKNQSKVMPTNSTKQVNWSPTDTSTNISRLSRQTVFDYQSFVAVSVNLGGKTPVVDVNLSSHQQENFPNTSISEDCMEIEIQTDRIFLAVKLIFVNRRGY